MCPNFTNQVSSKIPVSEPIEGKVRFNGSLDGKVVFDGDWWYGSATNLTVGKYYSVKYDAAAGSQYLIIINDAGEEVNFRKSTIEASLSG
ncbi:hypothetical protein QF028_002407 [Neobacillus sp. B4I6]|uniref:hypothetical protein n=1 Tax=Neobacillus sp. B4I6 TaxID=3373925 RepID=UPI003D1B5BEB